METIINVLPYIQILLSVILITAIILQQTGSSLGGAFGGGDGSTSKHTRRGFEKTLFNATIIIAILFIMSSLTAILTKESKTDYPTADSTPNTENLINGTNLDNLDVKIEEVGTTTNES